MSWSLGSPRAVMFVAMVSLGSCGVLLFHEDNGTLSSPDYPSDYKNNVHQVYKIHLQSTAPLQVRLDYVVDLEEEDSARNECHDKLQIADNSWELCGAANGTIYLSLQSNSFQMEFTTDSSVTKTGFKITYSVLQGDCNATVDLWLQDDKDPRWVLMPITDMMTRNSVVMSVRCCWALRVRLTTLPDPEAADRKQIHIAEVNRMVDSNILTCSAASGNCSKIVVQPNSIADSQLVDCCEFRSFWISWTSTAVAMGHGKTVGSSLILSLEASSSMDVRFFYLLARPQGRVIASFDAPFPDSYCQPPASVPPPPPSCFIDDSTTDIADRTTSISVTTAQTSLSEIRSLASNTEQITTAPIKVTGHSKEQCSCKCVKQESGTKNQTHQDERRELEQRKTEMAAAIKKDLTMSTSNVSASVRRKTSAGDERDSSTYLGFVVGLICFSPLVFIISCDCLALMANVGIGIKAVLR